MMVGAFGCGGLLAILLGVGLVVSRDEIRTTGAAQRSYTLDQAIAAWDTLSHLSITDSLAPPALPSWPTPALPELGTLVIGESRRGDYLPAFGDTFPPGAPERKTWEESAAQISLVRPGLGRDTLHQGFAAAGYRVFQARALFAAAVEWTNDGVMPNARLAMDSALSLAHGMQKSGALERLLAGARIERDAMVVLSRDTILAGGESASRQAAQRVAPFDRYVARVRQVYRLLSIAGSQAENIDDLRELIADSTLPLAFRNTAVRSIGLGWVLNASEPGLGIDSVRFAALRTLRGSGIPDSMKATIDRVMASAGSTFTQRIRLATAYRGERALLDWR